VRWAAAADFEQDGGGLFGLEEAGTDHRREGKQKAHDFFALGGEGVPPVPVAVVHNRAGAKDLLDSSGVFAGDADDHVG